MTENQIGYRTEVKQALDLLVEVAKHHPRVQREPEPTAQVINLADSGVELALGFWIEDPERGSQNVRSDVSLALLSEFRARGIEIPFPQREVRLMAESDTKIDLRKSGFSSRIRRARPNITSIKAT